MPNALARRRHVSRGGLGEVRVLVVAVVLAHEDDRQLPQLRQVHLLVEQPLPQRALAEEAHGHPAGLEVFGREGRARGDARAAADDGVGAQVAGAGVGDVHRPALALAVAGFLAEQLREHQVRRRALGQAVTVAAVGAGHVIVLAQRLAHADGDRLFPDVEVGQTRHQRARVEIVDPFLEQPDGHHLAVEPQQLVRADGRCGPLALRSAHSFTPDRPWQAPGDMSAVMPRETAVDYISAPSAASAQATGASDIFAVSIGLP